SNGPFDSFALGWQVTDVELDDGRSAWTHLVEFLGRAPQLGFAAGVERDVHTGGDQGPCRRQTDTLTGSRHQRGLATHVHVGGYHAPRTLGYVRRLTLIRHAMTDWNLSGRFQGVADIPLNDQGRRQARRLARYVEGLEGDAEVWSSPLIRAVQTAELAFPGRELQLDARLRELNFGDFEGK